MAKSAVERRQAAKWHAAGKSAREISRLLGCSPSSVPALVKSGKKADPLGDLKKPGRRPIASPKLVKRLEEQAKKRSIADSVVDFRKKTKSRALQKASISTNRRILRRVSGWQNKRQGLCWGDEASRKVIKSNRVAWAHKLLKGKQSWKNSLWVDAVKMRLPRSARERSKWLSQSGARRWWCTPEAANKLPPQVMNGTTAWHSHLLKAMCARDAKTNTTKAFFYEGKLTKAKSIALFKQIDAWAPFRDRTLISDNCPVQTSAIKQMVKDKVVKKHLFQPSRSPDTSAMDCRVFGMLRPKVANWIKGQNGSTSTKHMKQCVQRNLKEVDKSLGAGWEKCWPDRLRQIIARKGELLPQ